MVASTCYLSFFLSFLVTAEWLAQPLGAEYQTLGKDAVRSQGGLNSEQIAWSKKVSTAELRPWAFSFLDFSLFLYAWIVCWTFGVWSVHEKVLHFGFWLSD